ncbi:hypothetical protein ACLBX9_02435, partial [Methylobacterium sp. A49B]
MNEVGNGRGPARLVGGAVFFSAQARPRSGSLPTPRPDPSLREITPAGGRHVEDTPMTFLRYAPDIETPAPDEQ